jgi:hypothetical protein
VRLQLCVCRHIRRVQCLHRCVCVCVQCVQGLLGVLSVCVDVCLQGCIECVQTGVECVHTRYVFAVDFGEQSLLRMCVHTYRLVHQLHVPCVCGGECVDARVECVHVCVHKRECAFLEGGHVCGHTHIVRRQLCVHRREVGVQLRERCVCGVRVFTQLRCELCVCAVELGV